MGWIKQTKATVLSNEAHRAYEQGHSVYVAQIRSPVSFNANLTRTVPDVAEMIESIEAEGWKLEFAPQFLLHHDKPTTYVMFRRDEEKEL